jgi:hypothetical protein
MAGTGCCVDTECYLDIEGNMEVREISQEEKAQRIERTRVAALQNFIRTLKTLKEAHADLLDILPGDAATPEQQEAIRAQLEEAKRERHQERQETTDVTDDHSATIADDSAKMAVEKPLEDGDAQAQPEDKPGIFGSAWNWIKKNFGINWDVNLEAVKLRGKFNGSGLEEDLEVSTRIADQPPAAKGAEVGITVKANEQVEVSAKAGWTGDETQGCGVDLGIHEGKMTVGLFRHANNAKVVGEIALS